MNESCGVFEIPMKLRSMMLGLGGESVVRQSEIELILGVVVNNLKRVYSEGATILVPPVLFESKYLGYKRADLEEVKDEIGRMVENVCILVKNRLELELGLRVIFSEKPVMIDVQKTGWRQIYGDSSRVMKFRKSAFCVYGKQTKFKISGGEGVSGEEICHDPSVGTFSIAKN